YDKSPPAAIAINSPGLPSTPPRTPPARSPEPMTSTSSPSRSSSRAGVASGIIDPVRAVGHGPNDLLGRGREIELHAERVVERVGDRDRPGHRARLAHALGAVGAVALARLDELDDRRGRDVEHARDQV